MKEDSGDELRSEEEDSRRTTGIQDRLTRRHYKKDTRFVMDLYTLTFDENETVDKIEPIRRKLNEFYVTKRTANSPSNSSKAPMLRAMSTPIFRTDHGPRSLGILPSQATFKAQTTASSSSVGNTTKPSLHRSLETNLLRIMARKIQDSEEISFSRAKLLTKAYHEVLKNNFEFMKLSEASELSERKRPALSRPLNNDRLSWKSLLRAGNPELRCIVASLENTARVLCDYLVDLLFDKETLVSDQDRLLEQITTIIEQCF